MKTAKTTTYQVHCIEEDEFLDSYLYRGHIILLNHEEGWWWIENTSESFGRLQDCVAAIDASCAPNPFW